MDALELLTTIQAGFASEVKPLIVEGHYEAARMAMGTPLMSMGDERMAIMTEVLGGITFVSRYNDVYAALDGATTAPTAQIERLERCTLGRK